MIINKSKILRILSAAAIAVFVMCLILIYLSGNAYAFTTDNMETDTLVVGDVLLSNYT